MRVEIRLYGSARDVVGEKTVKRDLPDGATVGDLLERLVDEYPGLEGSTVTDERELQPSVNVARNGSSIENESGVDTELADGDRLVFAQSMRGG